MANRSEGSEGGGGGGVMVGKINEKQKYLGGQTNRSVGLNVLFVLLPLNGRAQGHILVEPCICRCVESYTSLCMKDEMHLA